MTTWGIILYIFLSGLTLYMLYYAVKNPSVGTVVAAFIITIFTIAIIVVAIRADAAQKQHAKQHYPPDQYMRLVGAQCPDYWTYVGTDPNNSKHHLCKNSYNIPVNTDNPPTDGMVVVDNPCYDDALNKTKSFSTLNVWPVSDSKLASRCDFIKKCGPTTSIPASWIGVDVNCQ